MVEPESRAHAFVSRMWPYLCGAAHRAAPRYGIEWQDLAQEFALYLLQEFPKLEAAGVEPMAFLTIRIKRVLATRFLERWRRMSLWRPLGKVSKECLAKEPVDEVELADTTDRLRELLAKLSPRRRRAVELRLGLDGSKPLAGRDLGQALGIRPTTAAGLVTAALRELAHGFGADVRFAHVRRGEGISLGHRAKAVREKRE